MSTTLNRKTALIAVHTERYGLSLAYFCFAAYEFHQPWLGWSGQAATGAAMLVETSRHLNRLLLLSFTALLLLLARPVAVPPQKLKNILIPLATTFFNFTYSVVPKLPMPLQESLCPAGLRLPLAIGGFILVVIGPMVALWGILYLGRSFGVFVEVRKVVLGGPYQWVRHPMYLGWICMYTGLALANFSAAYFILFAIHVGLLRYRAHLEETELAGYSADYREYMKRTGFIFPKFRRTGDSLKTG
jgi:protein-S-isoprenylcysteine O-methyltransferase Ste14